MKENYMLIVGGGKAGEKAFKYAKKKSAQILIIDSDPNCILKNKVDYYLESNKISELDALLNPSKSILIQGDIETAFSLLSKFKFKYIFPTVPVHLAAKFAVCYLKKRGQEIGPNREIFHKVLEKIPPNLIFRYNEHEAIIILSYMPNGLNCIESCSSPRICPVTKLEKKTPLFKIIDNKVRIMNGFINESVQIEPGLGGIEGESINRLFKFVKKKNYFAIATASRCHGILNSFMAN